MIMKTLSDDEVAELEARPTTTMSGYRRVLLRPSERDALCATVRALRASDAHHYELWLSLKERHQHQFDNETCKQCGVTTQDDHDGYDCIAWLQRTNTALREQLAEAQQLAETRSDIIAAKAAHIDQLQSRLAGHNTSNLLRRLKDFLFENCNHSERDRNYDWCPACVMAFVEVLAQPSNSELQSQLAQVTQERWAAVQALKDVRRIVGAPEIGADTTAWIDDIISKASNHEQPQP